MKEGFHTQKFWTREQMNICQATKRNGEPCDNVARFFVDGVRLCGNHNRFRKQVWVRIDEVTYGEIRRLFPETSVKEAIALLVKDACAGK